MHRDSGQALLGADEGLPRSGPFRRSSRVQRRMAWIQRLAVFVAMIVLSGGAPSPAAATSSADYFGTNLNTQATLQVDPTVVYGSLSDLGLRVNRYPFAWASIEPTPPESHGGAHEYSWAGSDALITALARKGLRVAPMFRIPPWWAGEFRAGFPQNRDIMPPSRYDDYAAMVAAFAERYGPGGEFWRRNPSLPAHPTLDYEIWNEVNLDEYAWNADADPVAYSALLKEVRPAVKAKQPDAVLLGSLAWQNDAPQAYPKYVAALAAAGGLAQLDAMGFHPYGPDALSTVELVQRLARELAEAGRAGMPIYTNENGWPVRYGEAGAERGYQGAISDPARGAMLAFAGEALAISDCSVEQFLPYSLVATGDPNEPNNEGFMGLFYKETGQPNETALALGRASARWSARVAAGLPPRSALCSAGPTPAEALLPIQATFTGNGSGCVAVHATYDGGPLESAYLRLRQPNGGELASARTDARGNATACVETFLLGSAFTAVADIAKAGTSGAVACDVPGVGCPAGVAVSPGFGQVVSAGQAAGIAPPPPPKVVPPAPACEWKLTTKHVSTKRRRGGAFRVKLRAKVDCTSVKSGTAVRFVLSRRAKNAKKDVRIRSVFLKTGRQSVIEVETRFRKSDRLVLLHAPQRGTSVPRIQSTISVRLPTGSR